MPQQKYKQQHTASEAYLRRFSAPTTPNSLWEYNKSSNSCKRRNVNKATVWFWGYSFRQADGDWNHLAEISFQRIEDVGIPVLRELITSGCADQLSPNQRLVLSLYIASMYRRSRVFIKHYQKSIEEFSRDRARQMQLVEDAIAELADDVDKTGVDQVMRAVEDGILDACPDESKALHLQGLFTNLDRGARLIAGMNWRVLTASPPEFFLTSDAPVYLRLIGDPLDTFNEFVAFSHPNAELIFPLSHNRLMLARYQHWREPDIASPSRVSELNGRTIRMAHSRVYARITSKEISSLVDRNRHFVPPLPPAFGLQR